MDRTVLADGISAATKKNANFEDLGTTSWQLKTGVSGLPDAS
jgi:hypothetical protein